MNETRENGNSEVMTYVRDHDVSVEHRSTDAIQRCLIGLNVVKRRANEYKFGEIRRYFGT